MEVDQKRLDRKDEQQIALENLKIELSSYTVIVYFDHNLDKEVITRNASPIGISGIHLLTQEGKVVAYASRALTYTVHEFKRLFVFCLSYRVA